MADEIVYRYCLTCRKKYKSTGMAGQTCTKCGGLLADTPTGVTKPVTGQKPKPATATPPAPRGAVPETSAKVEPATEPTTEVITAPASTTVASSGRGEFTCTPLDVVLCFIHNVLTGIPILGLIWCGISVFANPLKSRVSKGTVVAGLISNAISTVLLILIYTVFKG